MKKIRWKCWESEIWREIDGVVLVVSVMRDDFGGKVWNSVRFGLARCFLDVSLTFPPGQLLPLPDTLLPQVVSRARRRQTSCDLTSDSDGCTRDLWLLGKKSNKLLQPQVISWQDRIIARVLGNLECTKWKGMNVQ